MERRTSKRLLRASTVGLFGALAAMGACSVLNSFDDVKPGPGTGGASSSTSSTGSSVTASSSGMGGMTTSTASSTVASSSSSGGADAGGPLAIVVGVGFATADAGSSSVIVSLDATSGAELSRVTRQAVTITYDGLQDRYYVLTAGHNPPGPQDTANLFVYSVSPMTGVITEISSVMNVPVPQNAKSITTLRDRLVYAAYDPNVDAGMPPIGLAVFDTTNPAAVVPAGAGFTAIPVTFSSLVGAPGASPGGNVNLLVSNCDTSDAGSDMDAGTCSLDRFNIAFPPNPVNAPQVGPAYPVGVIPVAPNKGSTSATVAPLRKNGNRDVVAFPPIKMGMDSTVEQFSPLNGLSLASETFALPNAKQLTTLVVAECQEVALLQESTLTVLIAEPLAMGGTIALQPLGKAATSNATFEPLTSTIVLPFNPPNASLDAYRLGGTKTVPTLVQRIADWNPPSDVRFTVVAARQPLPIDPNKCP